MARYLEEKSGVSRMAWLYDSREDLVSQIQKVLGGVEINFSKGRPKKEIVR